MVHLVPGPDFKAQAPRPGQGTDLGAQLSLKRFPLHASHSLHMSLTPETVDTKALRTIPRILRNFQKLKTLLPSPSFQTFMTFSLDQGYLQAMHQFHKHTLC